MAGCTVLVTADRRKSELAAALQRRGAEVRHAPALSMIPHADDEQLLAGTRDLVERPPDVVVVTTGIGFRSWVEAADAHGLADRLLEVLADARIVARGPKARGAIQAAGLTADWVAESETSAEIADVLLGEGVAGLRIAVQHHGAGADGLDVVFAEAGAEVASLVVYRWGPPPDPEALRASVEAAAVGEIDAVVFTSAPGAEAWLSAAEEHGVGRLVVSRFQDGSMVAAAVGPVTARPLEHRGVTPLQPERGRLGALVRTLVAHYEQAETVALATVAGTLQIRSRVAVLDGEVLPLSPSSLEVLRLLAARRGEVVTRDDVLDVLPGDSRDPHAAEVAVARLREATGRRDLVRTVVKRGYRLELA
ncbi:MULTISPECIES: uroporphyrinogen-III synthase [Cellulosimicrobium]|uniref:uroporphyrinogen-III synthase n=1 Tax=Cellulosimicrobium TaxID=157920 RepID=UPI0004E377EF|nr:MULTISPECIES: uroporphyrinogen-III synthase [Cellulosimicrobium]ARK06565.1 uroporphyrinogen-III synthase [Cellulosimicrobium sp. TH-20]KFD43933.1 uroporphyrinogen-III synthase [Cellulosimicrobium sp. MM]PTU55244.1 uroporphyrinogen-III synthase [Sphaerisporangium cinnabarinum]